MSKELHTSLVGQIIVNDTDGQHAEVMAVWVETEEGPYLRAIIRLVKTGEFKAHVIPSAGWRSLKST